MKNLNSTLLNTFQGEGFEFIAVEEGKVKTIHKSQVLNFEQTPKKALSILGKLYGNIAATITELENFTYRHFGGMDNQLDICENGIPSKPEFLDGVSPAFYDNGKQVSEAELRVLKLITHSDECIGEKLFISKNTVARHVAAIYINLGFSEEDGINKRTYAYKWAIEKGII